MVVRWEDASNPRLMSAELCICQSQWRQAIPDFTNGYIQDRGDASIPCLTKVDRCVQDKNDPRCHVQYRLIYMCRLWTILVGHVWRHWGGVPVMNDSYNPHVTLVDLSVKEKTMRVGHMCLRLTTVCRTKMMHEWKVWHWLTILFKAKGDMGRPHLTSDDCSLGKGLWG